jgi:triacylglycerol lipase
VCRSEETALIAFLMLARLQQFITVSLVSAATAWVIYFAQSGRPAWGVVGAVLILGGYAVFLGVEFLLLAWVQESSPVPPPTATHLLKAWWGEVLSAPPVFCWRQPFRSTSEPDHLDVTAAGSRGVVFVHGFVCNRGFWNPWMKSMRATGVPFVAVNLEPLFDSISRYSDTIDEAVRRVERATGRPPVVVAHSMGGLAVRAWLDKFDADRRVHRIITVGTPHSGTWLARYGRTVNSREMSLKSPWLIGLAAQSSSQRHALFTCFYSNCDNIVFPASTATLPGADNRHIPGTAHVHMAFQPAVFNEVSRWLATPDSSPAEEDVAVRARTAQ